MDKTGPILSGIFLILLGIGITIKPKFYDRVLEHYFDFTGYNIPLGIFMIIVGGLLLWTSLKKNKHKEKE